ncbi:uncharacterized protein LOC122556941 isoform X1 [Chiloscyllium plagiosum]|uniref:uncharacterized protein LOC122556941 isoform X1 n=1 Tax=Chiloscyllium plagiosum TaxID=36176 RepID=UPI001CB7E6D1|nr:uncharacterized protein LOC122556941 isoform X1 [Chiloscyllium plagiosum]
MDLVHVKSNTKSRKHSEWLAGKKHLGGSDPHKEKKIRRKKLQSGARHGPCCRPDRVPVCRPCSSVEQKQAPSTPDCGQQTAPSAGRPEVCRRSMRSMWSDVDKLNPGFTKLKTEGALEILPDVCRVKGLDRFPPMSSLRLSASGYLLWSLSLRVQSKSPLPTRKENGYTLSNGAEKKRHFAQEEHLLCSQLSHVHKANHCVPKTNKPSVGANSLAPVP